MIPVGASRRVAFLVPATAAPQLEWQGLEQLDDRLWLVGRVRLDRRGDLRAALGEAASTGCSDGRLCLFAYAAWGGALGDHLAGDFCFALWDEARGTLIAVRDQLGVRSLFHAELGGRHFISDSLDWLAHRDGLDRGLDDTWIADFLASGRSLDFDRTVYRSIKRLPPAHVLTLSGNKAQLRRYWQLEVAEPIYFRDRRLYTERFRELVSTAIADRLPASGQVGVALSGGLDSTMLAALAVSVTGDPGRVVAVCDCFQRLIDDPEPRFATLAARHLGIELRLSPRDDEVYDPDWRARSFASPEPSAELLTAQFDRPARQRMAAEAPVWLFGEGPDNALVFESGAYLSWLAKRGDVMRLAGAVMQWLAAKGLSGWLRTARRYAGAGSGGRAPSRSDVPAWLDPDFVAKQQIRERVRAARDIVDRSHAWHPRAVGSFKSSIWQSLLRDLELDGERAPMSWRWPYFDLAVLQFMLSVPPVPWARGKLLIRQAMQGRLPVEILRRPKAPVLVLPDDAAVGDGLGKLATSGRLDGYVMPAAVPERLPPGADPQTLTAVHVLDRWIMYNRRP